MHCSGTPDADSCEVMLLKGRNRTGRHGVRNTPPTAKARHLTRGYYDLGPRNREVG
jgi:hypothetical protein